MEDFAAQDEQVPLLFRKRVILGIVLVVVVVVGGYFALSSALGWPTTIDAEPLRDRVEDLGPLGPLAFIGIMALSVLFAPIPNTPVFVVAGLVWGSVLGTVYSLAGLLLGSVIAFSLARRLGRKWMPRLIGGRAAGRLDELAASMGGRAIFIARMVPGLNFDWISFVAGVTSISFRSFLLASFLGMLLPTALTVVAGDGLGSDIRQTLIAIGIWLLSLVASAGYFWWERSRRRARGAAGSR